MQYKGTTEEYLRISTIIESNSKILKEIVHNGLTLLWFTDNKNCLNIDSIDYNFKKNQIICLTEFHQIEVKSFSSARMIRFNRPFYCIIDHDSEVGCKGILFFGASQFPIINITPSELKVFETVYNMFVLEIQTKDALQLDMLQMMLKRFLILCARVYKNQNNYDTIETNKINIIREYNFLVEQHFRTKHTVTDYAGMLNKSSKTLSNIFSRISDKSPLQFIHNRKMLEAKRLLRYTDKSIKEIAYEIGFDDIQAFSRFFKNIEQKSPSEFRDIL